MKKCKKCDETKAIEDFFRNKRNKDGRESSCKNCSSVRLKACYEKNKEKVRERNRQRYHKAKDPEKIKARNLRVRYGLTVEQYDKLISEGCFICGSDEKLCIDHDHNCCPGKESCGKCIRGVLCWNHNLGEARFKSIQEIERLLEYRKR